MQPPDTPRQRVPASVADLGPRAARTRQVIVDTARGLFLRHGYAGTSVADITEACGISRAGFYTYFRDKREIFAELGRAGYQSTLAVVARLTAVPDDWPAPAVEEWIRLYFTHLDQHGAFALAAMLSAPTDVAFRNDSHRIQVRVARKLGELLHARQRDPAGSPEAVGLVVLAMLDRCWYKIRATEIRMDEADIIAEAAALLVATIHPRLAG
ncbi:TetR/AcrR family transcriptional regulator [Frankia gtarii]|uniref:TetR/AcrR family transcriptional regulator n=1 Tax=Frankia gtarii TaxID=2950102 RepID=UPI0021BFBF5C|nr:TetR/AcrR family transcriptional regulator [Frankia gtarii]